MRIAMLGSGGIGGHVAQSALCVASADATWTTGTILTVDGGIMAQ
jgi:NAD(P)-dependent dehydrogenase (short-subunit alcohol dehydrogenase family)